MTLTMKNLPYAALLSLVATFGTSSAVAQDKAKLELGKQLFMKPDMACAVCHTLKDSGAEGAVGPVLDELKPSPDRVTKALQNGIGQMPSYKGRLDEAQIAAIAAYVARASGATK